MHFEVLHIGETSSTNQWLREHGQGEMAVWADHQTAGRGCGTNTWESEAGKNLLFSVMTYPADIKAAEQFIISMAVSTAIVDALSAYTDELCIKWPNDIYWHDRKLCGILIENRLSGQTIREAIIGIGLNVNQQTFFSDAPNPVSLCHIVGHEVEREPLLLRILACLETCLNPLAMPQPTLRNRYRSRLYRREGFHAYRDGSGTFQARLLNVEDDGHLTLEDLSGLRRSYAFKEVAFCL